MSGEWATGEENGEQNAAAEDFREAWMEGNMESRGVERRRKGSNGEQRRLQDAEKRSRRLVETVTERIECGGEVDVEWKKAQEM